MSKSGPGAAAEMSTRTPKTVQSLGSLLSTPVIVLESAVVSQVCLLMASKRADAVLLVDVHGSLAGILTAGDVSRKIVAAGIDPHRIKCSAVMTPSPLSVRANAPVSLALRQMVARRCRHLPVLSDEEGCEDDLAGLLDIIECVFSRLKSIDSKDLTPMRSVSVQQAIATSMLPLVGGSASIRDACIVMRDSKHTGVLVVDENDPSVLIGILTNKDVILRVLAAGLDPENITVEEAMTPQPDFVSPSTSVLEALQMLGDGHYLHLPVVVENKPVGLVDLLTLTMSILDHMLRIDRELNLETQSDMHAPDGPLWNRFWNSSSNGSDDALSQVFSANGTLLNTKVVKEPRENEAPPDNGIAPLDDEDSQSITSAGAFYRKQRQKQQAIDMHLLSLQRQQSGTPSLLSTVENSFTTGRDSFVFKLHDIGGTIHRFTASSTDFETFMRAVEIKTGRSGVRCVFKHPANGARKPLAHAADLSNAVHEARAVGAHRVVVYALDDSAGTQRASMLLSPRISHLDGLGISSHGVVAETGIGGSDFAVGHSELAAGWVRLNVGGVRAETKIATLVGASRYFAALLEPRPNSKGPILDGGAAVAHGELKIDRDGELFKHVLYFLRNGNLSSACASSGVGVLKDLLREAEFYGADRMIDNLKERIADAERVVVVGRDEMLVKLGHGFKVLFVEEEGKRVDAFNYRIVETPIDLSPPLGVMDGGPAKQLMHYDVRSIVKLLSDKRKLAEEALMLRRLIPNCAIFQRDAYAVPTSGFGRLQLERRSQSASSFDPFFLDYQGYEAVLAKMEEWAINRPDVVIFNKTIALSHFNRSVPALIITNQTIPSSSKKAIWWNGMQHAREWISLSTVMFLANQLIMESANGSNTRVAEYLSSFEIIVTPMNNPDGYAYTMDPFGDRLWRKNLRDNALTGGFPAINNQTNWGVDLNRNWGDGHWGMYGTTSDITDETYEGPNPFSEPEVAGTAEYIASFPNRYSGIDFHSFSQLVLRSWGWTTTPSPNEAILKKLGDGISEAIFNVRGTQYQSQQASSLYPASGK
ncbi:hypothetical protein HDU83_001200 [Entophlyctis luteolus]|nr:hypothetical protein HDU83_001200 [Entophlyctis luteolus]